MRIQLSLLVAATVLVSACFAFVVTPRDDEISCAKCKEYASIIVGVVNNTQLFPEVIALAEAECATKYANSTTDETLCKDVIAAAAKVLPMLLKGMTELAWDIPLTVCADVVGACKIPCCVDETTPEQFHLSLPGDVSNFTTGGMAMRVTWVTRNATPDVAVNVWPATTCPGPASTCSVSFPEWPTTRTYTQGGWIGTIHSADLTGLNPNTTYNYQLAYSGVAASKVFSFTTLPANIGTPQRPLRVVTIADMGYGPKSTNTIDQITGLVQAGLVDLVVHSGDISYADGEADHWDVFFNKIEPYASRVPMQVVPGNHELWWAFAAYKARLGASMPRAGNGAPADALYYTLRVGTLQLVMLNSETDIDTADVDATQVQWARAALAAANANRKAAPWVVASHHRPLYCTNHDKMNCEDFALLLRLQVEQLYYENGVDVHFSGHLHSYERTLPLFQGTPTSLNYSQPTAPVYVVGGCAGNREGNTMPRGGTSWSAFRSSAIGFTTMTFSSDWSMNEHDLTIAMHEAATGETLDSFTIKKSLK